MSEQQRDTAVLRRCLLYDGSAERHQLEARITQTQRDERSVWRAVWLMSLLTGLAMAGLCYAAVFLTHQTQNVSQFITPFVVKVLCALGVGSLVCMMVFLGLGVVYRKELEQRREECRRLATKLLESRLGKPNTVPSPWMDGSLRQKRRLTAQAGRKTEAIDFLCSPGLL